MAARDTAAIRDAGGRFVPGVSGNPGGRPAAVRDAVRQAQALLPAGLERLAAIITDPGSRDADAVRAFEAVAKVAGVSNLRPGDLQLVEEFVAFGAGPVSPEAAVSLRAKLLAALTAGEPGMR